MLLLKSPMAFLIYTFKLSITLSSRKNKSEIDDTFNMLLGCLRMHGQILGKDYPAFFKSKTLSYLLICPERTSLKQKNSNRFVKKYWRKLEEESGSKLQVEELGKDPCFDINECKTERDSYILYTNYTLLSTSLYCGNCFGQVPLYKIPPIHNEEYFEILAWESHYKACDTLQMGSTVGERFGLRQMQDFKSQLTQEGLEVCKKIQTLTGKPVYYYLFNYRSLPLSKDKQRKCPSCDGEWFLEKRFHKFDFKCDKCHLVSNLSYGR